MKNKTFPPSKRKLKLAREKGDILKSSELTRAGIFTLSFLFLIYLCNQYGCFFIETFESSFDVSTQVDFFSFKIIMLLFITPILFTLFSAIIIEVCQVKIIFKLPQIDFSNFNISKNLTKIFGLYSENNQGGLIFRIFKILFGFMFFIFSIFIFSSKILSLGTLTLSTEPDILIYVICEFFKLFGGILSFTLLSSGIIDLIFNFYRRQKKLSMDLNELKREIKEEEGDPKIKNLRKRTYQQIALYDITQNVRTSKIVIANDP